MMPEPRKPMQSHGFQLSKDTDRYNRASRFYLNNSVPFGNNHGRTKPYALSRGVEYRAKVYISP